MGLLKNKVAIITGASSGIGRASAKLFAKEGCRLILGSRRENMLLELAEEIKNKNEQIKILAGDVTSEAYNKSLVDLALSEFGKLDIAFNNAGTLGTPCSLPELELSAWNNTLETNLTGSYLGAKYQLPAMLKNGSGSIIFTSSFVGYTIGFPQQAAYAASKAGLIGLTKSLASEYGSQNIRVNALLPGGTNTAMAKEFGSDPSIQEFVKNIHALKRVASPEEIASSVLYLASDLSSFTTGSAMLVDGGVSINKT